MADQERTPLCPVIVSGSAGPVRICNCCQSDDRVVSFSFGWAHWPDEHLAHQGGSTSLALCASCRDELRVHLDRLKGADRS